MKTAHTDPAAKQVWKQTTSRETLSRREVLAGLGAVGATMLLPGVLSAALDGKRTFTILHTNDLHSNFIGIFIELKNSNVKLKTAFDDNLTNYKREIPQLTVQHHTE